MSKPSTPLVPEIAAPLASLFTFPSGPDDIVVYYDFLNDTELSDWAFSQIGTNTVPSAVEDAEGGRLIICHTTNTDNTGIAMNYDSEFFKFSANRKYFFAVKGKMDDGTNGDYFMGMTITNTNPISAVFTDGVWLRKDDGDAQIDVVAAKDSTSTGSTSTNVATADSSDHVFAIYVETGASVAQNRILWIVDGVAVYEARNSANLVDDEEMTLHFTAHNGATGAPNFFNLDWVYFRCTRA